MEMLSLTIHELATNAIRYGALASENGQLSVTWKIEGLGRGRRLVLECVENAVAVPPRPADAQRCGFGRTLIDRALPYSLSAETKFELGADKLRCVISLSLAMNQADRVGD